MELLVRKPIGFLTQIKFGEMLFPFLGGVEDEHETWNYCSRFA